MLLKRLINIHSISKVLIPLFIIFGSALQAAEFRAEKNQIDSNDGHLKLEWDAPDNIKVEVQKSESKDFENPTVIYKGIDRASFISGLENGDHFFRVKEEGGSWSSTLTIHVKHQSLQLAFTLFTLGAVVFILTVLVVVKGSYRVKAN